MTRTDWDNQAAHYDRLNEDLREPVFDALIQMIEGKRVLELGCGTGRISLPLAQSGLVVTGLDYSAGMLAEFRRKLDDLSDRGDTRAAGVRLVHERMEIYEEDAGHDTIVCVNNTLLFLLDPLDQESALKRMYENLVPGGCAILQVNSPVTILGTWGLGRRTLPGVIGGDHSMVMSGIIDAYSQRAQFLYQYSHASEPDFFVTAQMRYVWFNELILMCRGAGFSVESAIGGWDGRPIKGGSEIILKLRKEA